MRNGLRSALLAGLCLFAAACAPLPTPTPLPTPRPLLVHLDPLLEPIRPLLVGCLPVGYTLYEAPVGAKANALLSWGQAPGQSAQAFMLGSEHLVVILNPKNPVNTLSLDQVRQIYSAKLTAWGSLNPSATGFSAWAYTAENPASSLLLRGLALQSPADPALHLAANPLQLRAAVAADPGAIGYLPSRWVDASVKAVAVSGLDDASLSLPILATTPAQPEGNLQSWLLCVQTQLGKP